MALAISAITSAVRLILITDVTRNETAHIFMTTCLDFLACTEPSGNTTAMTGHGAKLGPRS